MATHWSKFRKSLLSQLCSPKIIYIHPLLNGPVTYFWKMFLVGFFCLLATSFASSCPPPLTSICLELALHISYSHVHCSMHITNLIVHLRSKQQRLAMFLHTMGPWKQIQPPSPTGGQSSKIGDFEEAESNTRYFKNTYLNKIFFNQGLVSQTL